MSLNWIWLRFINAFISPKSELKKIRTESGKMGGTYLYLLILCFLVGLSYIKLGLNSFLSETSIWLLTCILLTFGVWFLLSKFNMQTNWAKALKVITFSITPMLIVCCLINIINYKPAIFIGIIYSACLYYLSLTVLFKQPIKKYIIITLLTLLTGVVCIYMARVLIP